MTANTPAHLQGRSLLDDFHLLHGPVTLLAIEACTGHVHLVAESNVIWEVMNLDPFHGLVLLIHLGNFFDVRLIGRNDLMASHTGVQRGNTRNCRTPRSGVTVLTRDLFVPSVELVAKGDRLLWLVTDIVDGITRGPHPPGIRTR
jgi:hypothetical protein